MKKRFEETTAKWRNITIEADVLPTLHEVMDHLEKELGFKPTLSQTVRYLIAAYARLNSVASAARK
jgi:hypothetical protein